MSNPTSKSFVTPKVLPWLLLLGAALSLPSLVLAGDPLDGFFSNSPYGSSSQRQESETSRHSSGDHHNPPPGYYGEQYPGQRSGVPPENTRNNSFDRYQEQDKRSGYSGSTDPRYDPDRCRYR